MPGMNRIKIGLYVWLHIRVRKIKIGESGHVSNDIEVYNTQNSVVYVHLVPLFYYNV